MHIRRAARLWLVAILSTGVVYCVFPERLVGAVLVYSAPSNLSVSAVALGSPYTNLDDSIENTSASTPTSELDVRADNYSQIPGQADPVWFGPGSARAIASYGDAFAPYHWWTGASPDLYNQMAFVYSAASAFGYSSEGLAHSISRVRIMPEAGEFMDDPITLKLMLAEGVWWRSNHFDSSVTGRVTLFDSTGLFYRGENFFAGHELSTFVDLRDVPVEIGDYVEIEVTAFTGREQGQIYSINRHQEELAAFLFAEVPTSGVRFFSNFHTGSPLSNFPPAPRAMVPEPSTLVLLALGALALCAARRTRSLVSRA